MMSRRSLVHELVDDDTEEPHLTCQFRCATTIHSIALNAEASMLAVGTTDDI